MANHVYPELVRAMAEQDLSGPASSLDWVLQCYDADLVYDPEHLVLADVAGTPLGDPLALPSVAVVVGADPDGEAVDLVTDDDPPLQLTGVASVDDVASMLVFIDTGNPATSTLAAYYDRRADTSPVAFSGTGAAVAVSFPFDYFIRL